MTLRFLWFSEVPRTACIKWVYQANAPKEGTRVESDRSRLGYTFCCSMGQLIGLSNDKIFKRKPSSKGAPGRSFIFEPSVFAFGVDSVSLPLTPAGFTPTFDFE